jgi:murein endopeptidase
MTITSTVVNYIVVAFRGLLALPSHPSLQPYQNDTHPNNHHGRPDLVAAILKLTDAFAKEFPKDKLWINDMSLPTGGRFDVVDTAHQFQPVDDLAPFRVGVDDAVHRKA